MFSPRFWPFSPFRRLFFRFFLGSAFLGEPLVGRFSVQFTSRDPDCDGLKSSEEGIWGLFFQRLITGLYQKMPNFLK